MSKNKKEDYVENRMQKINCLKGKLDQAKKRIEHLEKNIEDKGISANFSINEDLLDISKTIWKYCFELNITKK